MKENIDNLTSLIRATILIVIAFVCAMIVAPLVYHIIVNFTSINEWSFIKSFPPFFQEKISEFTIYISEQPFRRIFNRVILVTIIIVVLPFWKWIGIKFEIKPLFRKKRAVSRFLVWFIIGFICIAALMYAQVYAGIRIPREKSLKIFSALLSALTVALLEETIFRGVILQSFLQKISKYKAIFIVSAIFALVHLFSLGHFLKSIKEFAPDGSSAFDGFKLVATFFLPLKDSVNVVPGLIGLFLAGWLLAELTVRNKSLWPAIGLHAGWVFTIKMLGRIWKYPSTTTPSWFFGEKFAATGIFGWILVGLLILIVNGFILYLIYRIVTLIIKQMPHNFAVNFGKVIGGIGYYSPKHRKIALDNIKNAFPEKSKSEHIEIAKNSFSNLGIVILEFFQFEKIFKNHKKILKSEGLDFISQALKNGKGVIFFTGHFGNWELLTLECGVQKYDFVAVARPLKNKWIYNHIQKIRKKTGSGILDKKGIVRDVIAALRANKCVGFVGDQYAGKKGLFVDFFGRPASTTSAMATFARKTGATIIPAFNLINPDGTHISIIYPPVYVPQTDNAEKDIFDVTQKIMKILENEIRQHPGQWLWAHRKWRKKKIVNC